jgi:hypothetical protein
VAAAAAIAMLFGRFGVQAAADGDAAAADYDAAPADDDDAADNDTAADQDVVLLGVQPLAMSPKPKVGMT